MLVLLCISLTIGWLCGGRNKTTQKTLALVTTSRNAGVGLVIALSNFAGTSAVTAVVLYTIFAIATSLIVALGLLRCVPQA